MITSDYSIKAIDHLDELQDLKCIAGVSISTISLEDYPNLLVFPDTFTEYDRDFGRKKICEFVDENQLLTNSIVGFIGRNNTKLSIHSRFAKEGKDDYFLHYMLQKIAKINILNLKHTLDDDSVFDYMLYLFPVYLKKAITQGLYKQYITHKHNDANVRGVIDINRHIKYNEPFNGKVAYTTREYSYDNDITQLIRHTIEYISKYKEGGIDILSIDNDTKDAVSLIVSATSTYQSSELQAIINKNIRPLIHPYYSEYAPLQRLCVQILRHEELKYGQEEDEMYGVLIDAAWLWEEYLELVLEGIYDHYRYEDKDSKYYLFKRIHQRKNQQRIIPDYRHKFYNIVADAKYIPINEHHSYSEEKATAIYYKTIAYMYRFCTKLGCLFYPHPDEDVEPIECEIETAQEGINGGFIIKYGLRIPSNCNSFIEFSNKMEQYEKDFLESLEKSITIYDPQLLCTVNIVASK